MRGGGEVACDLIILDPPSFTRARGESTTRCGGYRELHLRSAGLLAADGPPANLFMLTPCLRREFESTVAAGFSDSRRSARIIRRLYRQPTTVLLHLPETFYLQGPLLEAVAGR